MTGAERLVDDERSLAALVDAIASESLLYMDTEFVRERTYYPQLCLLQIATPRSLACIDCLAELDLEPLFAALVAPGRTWLLHSARQDLEVIQQHAAHPPSALIDTQIAAGLLGHAPQIGLQSLLKEILKISLAKAFTRTDWAARPLPAGAVRYALDDVCYLPDLWQTLKSKLEDCDRLAWLEEDCRAALSAPVLTPTLTLWSRLKGIGTMEPRVQRAALSLVEWRERCAQRSDRPRGWICSDDLLMRVARKLPDRQADLLSIAEMPRRLAKRLGGEILSAIANSEENAASLRTLREQLAVPDSAELKQLQARARRRADELNIQPQALATRRELGEFLLGSPTGRMAAGWRWHELQRLARLSGKCPSD